MKTQIAQRSNVTVDDRRAVISVARGRTSKDIAEVNQMTFIRNALKDRMGWPRTAPAPAAVLDAAKEMAAALSGTKTGETLVQLAVRRAQQLKAQTKMVA